MNTRRQQNTPVKGVSTPVQLKQQQQQGIQQQRFGAQNNGIQQQPAQQQIKTDGTTDKKEKPAWQLRKANPEIRRLRLNAKYKKVVKPKNAVMVLHEMYPDIVYKIDEVATPKTSLYRVHFELNEKSYSGEGYSKSAAKTNACENALKAFLLEKLAKDQEEEKANEGKEEAMETDADGNPTKKIPLDDFPWGKLAGFALHKLMDSCINPHGEAVPPPFQPPPHGFGGHPQPYGNHPNHVSFSNFSGGFHQRESVKPVPGVVTKVNPRKKFPDNPLEYNPVSLYNQTWPNVEPNYDIKTGADGKPEHIVSVALEGYRFSASHKTKKEAKADLARAVISTLRGVKYPEHFKASVMKA